MPVDKSDPLDSSRPPTKVTLWLDADGMAEARENYWQAFQASRGHQALHDEADRKTWDIAYAAAVSAFDFLQSGRITPR